MAEQPKPLRDAMTDWSQIVEQHGPQVWRTAQRLLCHETDAADCFQRTFIAALEISRKQAVRNWPALLRHLATVRALEQLRGRMRERSRFAPSKDKGCVNDYVDGRAILADSLAEGNELAAHMRMALAAIEPR